MGIIFNRPLENITSSFEFDFDYVPSNRGYLKELALQTVVGYVAKSIASSEFRHLVNELTQYDSMYYTLNVKPNVNQSASQFWYEVVYRLLSEREVLIIFSDDGQMLIADHFQHTRYAVVQDTFSGVQVRDFTYQRTFSIDDVIYLRYSNGRLDRFLKGMFEDYTDLYNRMVETQMLSSQLRIKVDIDANINSSEEQRTRIQNRIDKMFSAIRSRAIAFIPVTKGFNYEEIYNGQGSNASQSVDGLTKLKNSLIDEVADIIGVPQNLVHGNVVDLDSQIKAFVKFVINPINKLIEDELNDKIIGRDDYLNGEYISIRGIQAREVIESSDAVDKLSSSGVFSRNEVRELFGQERIDDPDFDNFIITKNFTVIDQEN